VLQSIKQALRQFQFISFAQINFQIYMGFVCAFRGSGKKYHGLVASTCQIAAHTFY
jgi:hypothetical protein